MKTKLFVLFFVLTSFLRAEVIFYDNFNRPNGEVGNSWITVGPAVNSEIEAGVMKIDAGFNRGISRSFTEINSGIYYVQYDWKFSESDWFVSSFPSDIPVHLLWENTGSFYTDPSGVYANPVLIGQVAVNTWATVKWKVNIDTNQYSIWINDDLVAEDLTSNPINLFNSFTFRTANGSFGTQFIDNFVVFNNTAPQIPSGLTASGSVNEINLNWTEIEDQDFITYKIYRSLTSPATDFLAETQGNQNSYIDTSAEANTDYFYRIKAVSLSTLESPYSEEVTSHLLPLPALTPESYILNLRVDNPSETIDFSLSNNGSYHLNYNLSGTDDLAPENQLPIILDFSPMGIHSGHAYYVSNSDMDWHSAKALCQEKGGHLVTISNLEENTFVYENTQGKIWLGFTDEELEGNWEWITGEPVSFTNWLPGEPNNSNNDENYAHLRHTAPFDKWNDEDGSSYTNFYAVLEFDYLLSPSILIFDQSSGNINSGDFQDISVSVDGNNLADGIHETSIRLNVQGITQPYYYPITINVDFNPPSQVSNVSVNSQVTDANQIGINWDSNNATEQVLAYKIYRRGRDEVDWRLLATLPNTQLSYTDNQFTPIDSTFVYYSVTAEDWVGNLSQASEPIIASLQRYLAPESLVLANIEDRDIQLSWNPVTHTITGVAGTPSCYIIYKSQRPLPLSEYDFLAVSFTPEYTHNWALYFQPADKLFYIVTAYGGNMQRLNQILSRKESWKRGELEEKLRAFRIDD